MADQTPHWDTPYGTPAPGSGRKKLLVLILVPMVALLGCIVVGLMNSQWKKMKQAREVALTDAQKLEQGEQPKAAGEDVKTTEKRGQLARLHGVVKKLKSQEQKILPKLRKYSAERKEIRTKLKRMAANKDRSARAKAQMKADYKEFKSLTSIVKMLKRRLDKVQVSAIELEQKEREVSRKLELSDFLDDKAQAELEKALAEGEATAEQVDADKDELATLAKEQQGQPDVEFDVSKIDSLDD